MERQSGVRSGRRQSAGWMLGVAALIVLAAGAGRIARADENFRCELKEARGVAEADATTAADLVCAELRRASGGRGAFGIKLATLGKIIVVTATREEPAGSVTVQADGIEELPKAAPRIADALARTVGFATTQRVDNLLQGETRPALAKKGSVKFSLGVADVESLGHGARGSGFSLGLVYMAPRFALPIEMRFGWDNARENEKGLHVFSLSLGARRYLSTRDVSPFVGGGLGILSVSARDGGGYDMTGSGAVAFDGDRSGIGPYLEAGVEMLRLHRGRVAFVVRADFPTGSLRSEAIEPWSYREPSGRYYQQPGIPERTRYVAPLAVGVNVAF